MLHFACVLMFISFVEKKGLSKEETGDLIIDMVKGVGKQIKSESMEIDIKKGTFFLLSFYTPQNRRASKNIGR